MNDSVDRATSVLRIVADFLRKLPDDQLDPLIHGEARLMLVPRGSRVTGAASPRTAKLPDVTALQQQLDAVENREEAASVIESLRLTVTDLRQLATKLGIPTPTRIKKAELIDLIVDGAVGARLTDVALRTSY